MGPRYVRVISQIDMPGKRMFVNIETPREWTPVVDQQANAGGPQLPLLMPTGTYGWFYNMWQSWNLDDYQHPLLFTCNVLAAVV